MVDVDVLQSGSFDQSWIENQAQLVVSKLSGGNNSDYTLLTLIESLGPVLTNTSTSIRHGGLSLVTLVIDNPNSKLHAEDVGLLTLFYLDRLRDHHSLLPTTLQGLSSLAKCPELSFEHIEKLLNGIFTEVMVQQQVVKDRSLVFTMLIGLLKDRLEDIKLLSTQFTIGFLQAFEGEKDPRNLLLIFSSVGHMLDILSISHLAEDVFESLAVYFPVDFTPPSGLVGSVTKAQLVEELRNGLSHPSLAEWTVGLLLEKLESDLESAKIDSLETMLLLIRRCERTDDGRREIWAREVEGVWAALKRESMGIRLQPSKEVINLSGEVVKELSKLLGTIGSLSTPEQDLAWSRWSGRVWDDCRCHLDKPNTRLMSLAGGVLAQVASSGQRQAKEMLLLALPSLFEAWEKNTGVQARGSVLEVSGYLLHACASTGLTLETELLDKMFAAFILSISAGGDDAVKASVGLSKAAGILSKKQQSELANVLLKRIQLGEIGMGTALAALAFWNKDLIQSVAIPQLYEMKEFGFEAICRLWEAGFFSFSAGVLIEKLVDDSLTVESKETVLNHLSTYSLSEEDKTNLNTDEILCMLISWKGCKEETKMRTVLQTFAEILKVEHCKSVCSSLMELDLTENMCTISAVVSSVSSEILLHWENLIDGIIDLKLDTDEAWMLKTSIVNKCPKLAEKIIVPEDYVGWICIGLARRGDDFATPWLQKLVVQLDSPGEQGKRAASMIGKLLDKCWWRHAISGILFKQRVWSYLYPALSEKPDLGENHLSALVSLVPFLPQQILLRCLPTLLPTIVKALSLSTTSHAALSCLNDISKSSPDLLNSHLVEIVHRCLELSQNAALNERILSLNVLASCTKIEGPTAVQLASKVKRDLSIPLKDRKRVVRVEAARARNMWFLVTQPS